MYFDDHGHAHFHARHASGLTPDIAAVSVVRHCVLRLTFIDGTTGEVEVLDRMRGPIFERALTPAEFAAVAVDSESGRSSGLAERTSRQTRSTSASRLVSGLARTPPPEANPLGAPTSGEGRRAWSRSQTRVRVEGQFSWALRGLPAWLQVSVCPDSASWLSDDGVGL